MKSEGTTTVIKTGMYKLIGVLYIIAFATMNNVLQGKKDYTPVTISNESFAIGCNVVLLAIALFFVAYTYKVRSENK